MSDQPPFLSQTSGPPGSMYSSGNAPPLGPPPESVYPPHMPNYQPQQQAPYSTQATQPPFTHQTFGASAHASPPPHPSTHSPASMPPPFPTPAIHGEYPPVNPGLPPHTVAMPVPGIPQEPQLVAGGWERRDDRIESDEVAIRGPPKRPAVGKSSRGDNQTSHGQTTGTQRKKGRCTVV